MPSALHSNEWINITFTSMQNKTKQIHYCCVFVFALSLNSWTAQWGVTAFQSVDQSLGSDICPRQIWISFVDPPASHRFLLPAAPSPLFLSISRSQRPGPTRHLSDLDWPHQVWLQGSAEHTLPPDLPSLFLLPHLISDIRVSDLPWSRSPPTP